MAVEMYQRLTCPECQGRKFVKTVELQHGSGLVEIPGGYVCQKCGRPANPVEMLQQYEVQRLERELHERQEALAAARGPQRRPPRAVEQLRGTE